ncbi:Ragulator complex protein LAMTOR4 like [Pseudolycoriella hygida]|uniref:Late endosomal/lysosomal adaptor and MAPK and MTOR activator 4 n=1 Tax=Pseudolycoriella hygida TaxID=35572 RepID=A0A9Q0N3K4_9DIPT|nr:Ragulator complex protein LAMTOR4 like [Pseudolycoriella hygida]
MYISKTYVKSAVYSTYYGEYIITIITVHCFVNLYKMLALDKIPDVIGYLVLTQDGAVLSSGGELENDEHRANIINGLINITDNIDPLHFENNSFQRISIAFEDHSYIICLSNKKNITEDCTFFIFSFMATNTGIDAIDWTKYPPERVEGLKLLHKGPSSDEDGPPTEEELKMLCVRWECKVDMKVDNFVFWLMKKTLENRFKNDKEKFQRYIPKMFASIERTALARYSSYQQTYANKNKKYLEYCAGWRKTELRRIRFMDKLKAICSTWTYSSDSESEDSDNSINLSDEIGSLLFDDSRSSSVNTVINTQDRYNDYLETESMEIMNSHDDICGNAAQEEVVCDVCDEDLKSQTFLPQCTSTQS